MGIIKGIIILFLNIALIMIVVRIVKLFLEKIGVFGIIDKAFANRNENETNSFETEANYVVDVEEDSDDDDEA
jgi:hypothetical protein